MDGFVKILESSERGNKSSFKNYFVPLTTAKAITWIVVIGFVVFANMLFNNFVWDDKTYILWDPMIHSINFFELIQPNHFNTAGQYRPISALYFATMYTLFNSNSFFYHLLQLLLHIANTSLLFILFARFFKRQTALLLSIIFLIHPIQVESVTFIASTYQPIFFLFGISGLLLSLKDKISTRRLISISMLLLLSILSKETGSLFLIMVIVYRLLFKKSYRVRLLFAGSITILTYLFIRVGIGGITLSEMKDIPLASLTLQERLLNIPAIVFYYLKTFIFPAKLAISQTWILTKLDFQQFFLPLILALVFLVLLSILGIRLFLTDKKNFLTFLFFFFWLMGGLALHMQLFPLDMTVSDRWFYFPIVGLLGLIGLGLGLFANYFHNLKLQRVSMVILIFILCILSIRTMVRNTNWYDDFTLFTHDLKIYASYDIAEITPP